jgi:hypothetical protein
MIRIRATKMHETRNYDHSAIAEESLDVGFRGILVNVHEHRRSEICMEWIRDTGKSTAHLGDGRRRRRRRE